jgi:hypothetical protein
VKMSLEKLGGLEVDVKVFNRRNESKSSPCTFIKSGGESQAVTILQPVINNRFSFF